jgi:uncharacterized RDD family membrane protein YckC
MSDSTQNPPPEEPPTSYSTPPPPPEGGYQAPAGGYQQAPPPMQAPSGIGLPADLLMRFLARLIDYIVIGIANFIVVTIVVVGAIMGSSAGGFGMGGSFAAGAVYAILSAGIYLGYFALLESRNGQTLGKMLLKLQTQGPNGETPTMEQAIKRNAFTAIGIVGVVPIIGGIVGGLGSLIAGIMIAVTISNSPTKQGWHDMFAGGTKVIKIG